MLHSKKCLWAHPRYLRCLFSVILYVIRIRTNMNWKCRVKAVLQIELFFHISNWWKMTVILLLGLRSFSSNSSENIISPTILCWFKWESISVFFFFSSQALPCWPVTNGVYLIHKITTRFTVQFILHNEKWLKHSNNISA